MKVWFSKCDNCGEEGVAPTSPGWIHVLYSDMKKGAPSGFDFCGESCLLAWAGAGAPDRAEEQPEPGLIIKPGENKPSGANKGSQQV